ncbi:G-type lectin S-receptor-like serine/threonine-protein kinase [Cinnamomum micranthum f. kanehirae]|uniref:non-specific serine/threonine protein kinase n=1 Tax=Cinnamomum micranthum f. kanehirae TaxID=337451 RepID=A0A3S3NVL5_9MAGN|nr:G-type lectin S-receptor-like serine/threonine-protein kinase [Cinnamomum micranthum f. kanehirae]
MQDDIDWPRGRVWNARKEVSRLTGKKTVWTGSSPPMGIKIYPPTRQTVSYYFSVKPQIGIPQIGIRIMNFSFLLALLFCCCCFFFDTHLSEAADSISPGQSLTGDQNITSKEGNFVLGFFTPGNSNNYYIGIWYKKVQEQTIVWVANREAPVPDKSSQLKISEDGNLVLINQTNIPVWSTNINSNTSNSTVAVLHDNGNLVLSDGSNSSAVIWQSFDYPTHTLLPTGRLGLNKITGRNQQLTSWRSIEDPAPGPFSLEIDLNGTSQYMIVWNGVRRYWTSGEWNGQIFSLVPEMTLNYIYNLTFESDEKGNYVYYSVTDPSIISRFVMDVSGQIKQLSWLNQPKQWALFWSQPRVQCEVFSLCGSFGMCNEKILPICGCVRGFVPRSPKEWSLGDWSGGCVRRTRLHCEKYSSVDGVVDKFLPMSYMLFPEKPISLTVSDVDDCKWACLNNCNCTAYAYDGGCLIWSGDLFNLQVASNSSSGKDLYIRLAASETTELNPIQCSNCGGYIIPYPLSSGSYCGHPNYRVLFCNSSSSQLYFRTLNGLYNVSSINADARTLVINPDVNPDLVPCSTQRIKIAPEGSALNCIDSTACYRYMQERNESCYRQQDCCSYVVEDFPYTVGVLSTGCNAYATIVGLSLQPSQYKLWEGVEIRWDPLLDDAHDELNSPGRKRMLLIIVSTTVIIGVILLATIVYCLWRRIKKKALGDIKLHRSQNVSAFGENKRDLDVPFFEFGCVREATENFSDSNKLGQGGFGLVYKGRLPEGQEVAAKRLSKNSGQGQEEFKNEVMLIGKLQHRNLVRLLGYCIKEDELILLYEYMPNKSLDYFLFDPDRCKLLSWEKRHDIILGIAKGLLYLHEDSRLRIIHRDLKTSNILLDEEMKPKISDFGLARIYAGNQNHVNTNRVVGTYGYMSPEYAFHGLFSVKSDVFSFGVIILEIISGKKNSLIYHNEESLTLLGYAWKIWKEEKWLDFIDVNLSEACELHELKRCLQIGLLCVQENSADRPTMASVVSMFISETTTLQPPQQPAFITTSLPNPISSSSSKNEVTNSTLEGR